MAVRAKFYVQEIARSTYGGRVKLAVVTRGEDNKAWANATPTGTVEMGIRNEVALEQFEVGQEFFVDFTPVPEAQAGQEGMA